MATQIGTLSVLLQLNQKGFTQGMKSAASNVQGFSSTASAAAGRIFGLTGAITGIGGALTAAGIALKVRESAKALDELAKRSDILGILPENLRRLEYAADRSGALEALDPALKKLSKSSSEAATGTGEMVKVFEELGLNASVVARMSLDRQFLVVSDAMNQVTNSGDRVRLSMKLFEEGGVRLINMMGLGSKGLQDMAARADTVQGVLSRLDLAKVEEANDMLGDVQKSMDAIYSQIAVELAPYMVVLSENLLGVGANGEVMQTKILWAFKQISKGSVEVARQFDLIGNAMVDTVATVEEGAAKILDAMDQIRHPKNGFLDFVTALSPVRGILQISKMRGMIKELEKTKADLAKGIAPSGDLDEILSGAGGSVADRLRKDAAELRRGLAQNAQDNLLTPNATAAEEFFRDLDTKSGAMAAKLQENAQKRAQDQLQLSDYEARAAEIGRATAEADKLRAETQTPRERLLGELKRANELYESGYISAATYDRILQSAQQDLANGIEAANKPLEDQRDLLREIFGMAGQAEAGFAGLWGSGRGRSVGARTASVGARATAVPLDKVPTTSVWDDRVVQAPSTDEILLQILGALRGELSASVRV